MKLDFRALFKTSTLYLRRSILTKWCSTHFFISRLYLHAFLSWVAGVGGTRLAEDEVVRAEQLPERARAHGVHRARLEVHEDRARDVAAARRLVENGFGGGGGTSEFEKGYSAWPMARPTQRAWPMARPILHRSVGSENSKWTSLKYTLMRSSCRSESPWYVPVGSMPCSSEITCENGLASSYPGSSFESGTLLCSCNQVIRIQ